MGNQSFAGGAAGSGNHLQDAGRQAGVVGQFAEQQGPSVEQINAAGGINGHKLKLEAQDDKCDPTAAVSIAQRFVNQSGIVGVLGPFCSAASIAVPP